MPSSPVEDYGTQVQLWLSPPPSQDEECLRPGEASDLTFLEKLEDKMGNHPHFVTLVPSQTQKKTQTHMHSHTHAHTCTHARSLHSCTPGLGAIQFRFNQVTNKTNLISLTAESSSILEAICSIHEINFLNCIKLNAV